MCRTLIFGAPDALGSTADVERELAAKDREEAERLEEEAMEVAEEAERRKLARRSNKHLMKL